MICRAVPSVPSLSRSSPAFVRWIDRHVLALAERFDDREVDLVDLRVIGACGILPVDLRQTDQHIVGRAVGRPEGRGQRHVGEGAPARRRAVGRMVETLVIETEVAVGNVSRPGAVLLVVPFGGQIGEPARERDAAVRVEIVVLRDVGVDLGIARCGDGRAPVHEEIGPGVVERGRRKGVAKLEIAVVDVIRGPPPDVTGIAGIVGPAGGGVLGLRVALRRDVGRAVFQNRAREVLRRAGSGKKDGGQKDQGRVHGAGSPSSEGHRYRGRAKGAQGRLPHWFQGRVPYCQAFIGPIYPT